MLDIFSIFGLQQHVDRPNHTHEHTLDSVIMRKGNSISNLSVDPPFNSDHSFVSFNSPLLCKCREHETATKSEHNLKGIGVCKVKVNLQNFVIESLNSATGSFELLFDLYYANIVRLMDAQAPL